MAERPPSRPLIGLADLDRPEVLTHVFHPRREVALRPATGSVELSIPVGEGIALGARYHPSTASHGCLLFFHGNGEIVADYDELAPFFTRAGAAFLAVDYRGYGRSSGMPSIASLLADSHAVVDFALRWQSEIGCTGPLMVMGRSLGSAAALEIAASYPEAVSGLILESAFAHGAALLRRLGLDVARMGIERQCEEVFDQIAKIRRCRQPTLILHGEQDIIIPLADARALFEASPAEQKRLLTIALADHNTLLLHGFTAYFDGIKRLVDLVMRDATG